MINLRFWNWKNKINIEKYHLFLSEGKLCFASVEEALIQYKKSFESLKNNDTIPAIIYRLDSFWIVSISKKA